MIRKLQSHPSMNGGRHLSELMASHWSILIILSSHWSMQCLKSVRAAVTDCKEVWINDDTFTAEEVEEIIKAVDEAVKGEVESELLNTR